MIDAKDLRIGNIARVANLTGKVTCIDIESDEVSMSFSPGYGYLFNDIQPIPLTPELFKKCGWNPMNGYHFNDKLPWLSIHGGRITVISGNTWASHVMINGYRIDMQYLHQLQNLYHCLTGEELEIDL